MTLSNKHTPGNYLRTRLDYAGSEEVREGGRVSGAEPHCVAE